MAKRNQLNVSVGVDTTAYKQGWDEVAKITVQSGQKTEQEAQKMVNALNKRFESLTIKQQIRQMETLAGKMEQMGLSGTKAFSDVIGKAGQLKATQSDLKDLIEASRPDAPFKAMGNAMQGAAQAMAGVNGAMALFGNESEDVQKALLKVQAALALVEGTKAIDQLSDSFNQLNMVMARNPLFIAGAIAAAIAAGIAMKVFGDNTSSAIKPTSDLTRQLQGLSIENAKIEAEIKAAAAAQQKINDAYRAGVSEVMKEVGAVSSYFAIAKDLNQSYKNRAAAINKLKEIAPQYFSDLTTESVLTDKATQSYKDYIAQALKRAQVQGLMNQLTEIQTQQAERFMSIQSKLPKLQLDFSKSLYKQIPKNTPISEALFDQIATFDSYLKYSEKILKQIDKVGTAVQIIPPAPPAPPAPKDKKPFWTADNTSSQQQIKTNDQGLINFNNEFERLIRNQEKLPSVVKTSTISMTKLWMAMHKVYYESEQINSALNQFTADTLANMAAAMGQAIANHENLAQAIGKSFLMSLADFLEQMGKMMVTTGTLWAGFQKMIVANPIAAAAIGVAAIAAGVALKTHVSNSGKKVEKFASGGMANSPTFALIGDNLNAHNNPEFVMRQDQLKKIYASGGGNNRELVMRMRGTDLYFFLEKVGRDIRR